MLMSDIAVAMPRGHLRLVSPGRRTASAPQLRGSAVIPPPPKDWFVDLSRRSGCLVVAPSAAPPTMFWAGMLLPLLRAFDGPVVLDLSVASVDCSAITRLASVGGSPWRAYRRQGRLRVVVAPADLSRTLGQLDGAGNVVHGSLVDAIYDRT
jgi:hypothetical protein